MSVKAMAWAWEQTLKPTDQLVLLALADHADDDGICWPGQKLIAEKCNVTRKTVWASLKRLTEQGLIASEQQFRNDGSRTSNLYLLAIASSPVTNLHTPVTDGNNPCNHRYTTPVTTVTQQYKELEPSLEPSLENDASTPKLIPDELPDWYTVVFNSGPNWKDNQRTTEWITEMESENEPTELLKQAHRAANWFNDQTPNKIKKYRDLLRFFGDWIERQRTPPSNNNGGYNNYRRPTRAAVGTREDFLAGKGHWADDQ